MKRTIILPIALTLAMTGRAAAEYMEIQASEIATIAESGRAAKPRIIVKWTLPEELGDLIIDGAAISMPVQRDTNCLLDVEVFPLSRSWSAFTTTWESGWTRAGGDYNDSLPSAAIATQQNEGNIRANVYDSIVDQVAGRKSNFGFIVIPDAESECRVATMTANDSAKRSTAKLIIAYRIRR